MKRIFISDCEGPISKNDNAFEITSRSVPHGDRLFTAISRYDDILADVLERPNHKAGDTLRLVVPFLKAYGVTDRSMEKFSTSNLVLISNAKETLQRMLNITQPFIVSTSYEHYIRALCKATEFPFENTYCTRLSFDKYDVPTGEKTELKQIAHEIAQMETSDIPLNAKSINDLSPSDQKTVQRLDEIFREKIPKMTSGRIYLDIHPVGGSEKADAINDIVERLGANLADIIYVGDSITDEEAFKLVRKNGGLTLSFNGNRYAIENAEAAILSESSLTTAIVADIFIRFGKQEALLLMENWNREGLEKSSVAQTLLHRLFELYPHSLPKVKIITGENMETLAKESSEFRQEVRGETIGRLG